MNRGRNHRDPSRFFACSSFRCSTTGVGEDFPREILYEKMRARERRGQIERERERDVHPLPTDLTQAGAVVIHKADIEPALECKSSGSQRWVESIFVSLLVDHCPGGLKSGGKRREKREREKKETKERRVENASIKTLRSSFNPPPPLSFLLDGRVRSARSFPN